jgi:hypothetical protein
MFIRIFGRNYLKGTFLSSFFENQRKDAFNMIKRRNMFSNSRNSVKDQVVYFCTEEYFFEGSKRHFLRLEYLHRVRAFPQGNTRFNSLSDFEAYFKKLPQDIQTEVDRNIRNIDVRNTFNTVRRMVRPMGMSGELPAANAIGTNPSGRTTSVSSCKNGLV